MWKKYSYFILLFYVVFGFFIWPAAGMLALVCMLAPILLAPFAGRQWCGRYCPRGSLWDQVFAKISPKKPIPVWAKAPWFRTLMLFVIFTVFGWQMTTAWPDPSAIGLVFLRIIFITTIIGAVLAVLYSPRTWCSFCPMGTLAALLAKGKKPLTVDKSCVNCRLCAKACPMDLSPQQAKGDVFSAADCLKCGQCIPVCPKKALAFQPSSSCSLPPAKAQ